MGKLNDLLKLHLVDATAGVSVGNPIYALIETIGLNVPDRTSWTAKLTGSLLSYAGLSTLYNQGRDMSLKFFGITRNTKKYLRKIHDGLYGAVFAFPVSLFTYTLSNYISGEDKSVWPAVITSTFLSLPMGIIGGYSVDTFRKINGLKPLTESEEDSNETGELEENLNSPPNSKNLVLEDSVENFPLEDHSRGRKATTLFALGSAAATFTYYYFRQ